MTCSEKHIALSLKAAEEGIVLLKNDNQILPLKKGTKIAFFGKGTFDYVKGGGGSGNVYPSYIRNTYDGFEHLGLTDSFKPLDDFYRNSVEEQYAKHEEPGMLVEPEISDDLVKSAKAFADVAVISISRFSGEGWDRSNIEDNREYNAWGGGDYETLPQKSGRIFPEGDFYLSPNEKKMIEKVKTAFDNIIVILNVGGSSPCMAGRDGRWSRDGKNDHGTE